MKLPKPPFHGLTNELLYAILAGVDCLGYENLEVSDFGMVSLTPPENAVWAMLVLEADPTTADKTRAIRFCDLFEDEEFPTAFEGVPLGHLGYYRIKGKKNLQNFRAIGVEAGKTHSLKVQYYG